MAPPWPSFFKSQITTEVTLVDGVTMTSRHSTKFIAPSSPCSFGAVFKSEYLSILIELASKTANLILQSYLITFQVPRWHFKEIARRDIWP